MAVHNDATMVKFQVALLEHHLHHQKGDKKLQNDLHYGYMISQVFLGL